MRKILFLTGTRADFGKIKSLINILDKDTVNFEVSIFITGMHMHKLYGQTYLEVEGCNFSNYYKYINHTSETSMDLTLAKTIEGLSSYIKEFSADLIIVHGDRVEALAGAIVGSLNNILVAHIEGGELSGTIDDLIRHAVSKMSHIHFVSNNEAMQRLIQLGESGNSIFNIGSPDMDVMFSDTLPTLDTVKEYYEISFNKYAIVMFHPVTTEYDDMERFAQQFVAALLESDRNYVVIYPNNDLGSNYILKYYKELKQTNRFRLFPSIRFEYFLTLLKNSQAIIGNSSAGIREAPAYGIPSINIGTRQNKRAYAKTIINCSYEKKDILRALSQLTSLPTQTSMQFGKGNSDMIFYNIMKNNSIWDTPKQKTFNDII
ncbi:MAG: UDP-N-acetylglucosamine 2-epimerase [Bacteroidales bacterium]